MTTTRVLIAMLAVGLLILYSISRNPFDPPPVHA